jgi:hypothetical protein
MIGLTMFLGTAGSDDISSASTLEAEKNVMLRRGGS